MRYRIRYTWEAVDDLNIIFDHASGENQNTAANVLSSFEKTIGEMDENPRKGGTLPTYGFELLEPGYRKIISGHYALFYRISNSGIEIARILNRGQDWLCLLEGFHDG